MTTPELASHRQQQGGPPLGVLALVSTLLFVIGLFAAAALAKGFPPAPTANAATIQRYFYAHRSATRVSALSQFAAAVPLALYAATASARLRSLGIRAPGATIALAGGLLSVAFLGVSALTSWVLSRAEIVSDPTLVRAFQDFGYITGGAAHVVFLGLLVAGIAVPAMVARLLPRPVVLVGLFLAGIAELSTLSIATDTLAVLLPTARFPILIWLVVAGFQLPRTRQRQNA